MTVEFDPGRLYMIQFHEAGEAFPIGADNIERMIGAFPAIEVGKNRLALLANDGYPVIIRPDELTAEPAFTIAKGES